jgi:hypothetical protein
MRVLDDASFGLGMVIMFLFVLAFQVKHLLVDFFLQNRYPYMWQNKHKLLHPGGWLHAGSHGLGSLIFFGFVSLKGGTWVSATIPICLAEVFVHFFIDMTKMRLNAWRGWTASTSPYFWDSMGVDQFLHQLTYLAMIMAWFTL